MYIDQKYTAWKRYYFPDNIEVTEFEDEEQVNNFINENMISCENVDDTECDMGLDENSYEPTIEVYNDDGDLIWDNANGKNI